MNKGKLSISDLYFEYPSYSSLQSDAVLSGLNLEVNPGEIVVIFGGAESGKSTLSLIISALVPAHSGGSISGRVRLDETDALSTEPCEIIEKCGIVFQDPERQTVTTECFTEVAFALESIGIPEDEITRRVEDSFLKLRIEHLLKASTAETSGGEKKKLALAGLISVNPDLWLLDETIEELDNPSRIELFDLLKNSGKTVIIFASKYYKAFNKADAFFLLSDGRLSARVGFPFSKIFKAKLTAEGILPDFSSIKRKENLSKAALESENSISTRLLEARGLFYSYEHGGFSLSADDFYLREGETLSIVGRNGCGKSTLARLLCGLSEPESGSIHADNNEVSADFLNSFCAYMFQNPDYQIFLPTVFEELAYGLKEAGYSSSVIKASTVKTIELFELPDGNTPPALMSFSARKRLQAAVYYLLKRPVFILDEADTGLSFTDFTDLVSRLKKSSRGIIIITHNLELASVVSDRVIGMSCGKIYNDILDYSPERLNDWLAESGDRLPGIGGRNDN